MSDGVFQIEAVVNADGVDSGVQKAKRSIRSLGDEAKKAGKESARSLGEAGKTGEQSAQKLDGATRRLITTIERQTLAMGKSKAEYYESLAAVRKLDQQALKPYIDRLRQAEAAQMKHVGALGNWRQMLAPVASLLAGVSFVGFTSKLIDVQRQFDVLNSSLITVTGSSANAAREFAWIRNFAATTPFALNEVTQAFVKMKALGLDATEDALRSYGNTASAMGKSLDQFVEAVADAATGEFERLKEFGVRASKDGEQVEFTFRGLTTTIRNSADEITEYLQRIGNVEFGGAMEQRAKTLDGALSNLGDTWDELFRTISDSGPGQLIYDSVRLASGAIEDAVTIMRALNSVTSDNVRETGAMSAVQEGLAIAMEAVAVLGVNVAYVLTQVGNEIGGIAAQAAMLTSLNFSGAAEIGRLMREDAAEARRIVDAQTAAILSARENAKSLADVMNAARAGTTDYNTTIGRLIALHNEGKITAAQFRSSVESLQPALSRAGKGAGEAGKGAGEAAKSFKKLAEAGAELAASLLAQKGGLSGDFAKKWEQLSAAYKTGAINVDTLIAAQAQLLAQQPAIKAAADEAVKLQQDYATNVAAALGPLEEQARKLELQVEQYGKTESQIQRTIIARLEEARAIAILNGALPEHIEFLEREIDARRRIAEASQNLDTRTAADDAAKAASAEWQRTADSIEQSLTDALMRGFEGGKDVAENFRDTLVNMFRTLVLRPIIQPIATGVAGGVTGMFAPNAAASTGASGVSPLNMIGSAGNIAGMVSGIASMAAGTALGSFGAGLASGLASWTTAGATVAGTAAAGATAGGAVGAGMLAGTALPVIGGVLALGSMLGWGETGEKYTPVAGGGTGIIGPNGRITTGEVAPFYQSSEIGKGTWAGDYLADPMAQFIRNISAVNSAFGDADMDLGYRYTTKRRRTSGDFQGGLFLDMDGVETQLVQDRHKVEGDIEKGLALFLNSVMTEGITDAIDALPVPEMIKQLFDGLVDPAAIQSAVGLTVELSNASSELIAEYEAVAASMAESGEHTAGILALMLNDFSVFRTQAENLLAAQSKFDDAFVDLGMAVPRSVEEFRALADGLDLTAEAGRDTYAQLNALAPAFNELQAAWRETLSGFGIDMGTFQTTVRDTMLGRTDAAEAGEALAKMVTDGIYNAIAGSYAQQITDAFTNQLIIPVVQAAMTGASVSEAVSNAAIDDMVASAKAAAQALGAIINDPEFKSALDAIRGAINDALGSDGKGVKPDTRPRTTAGDRLRQIQPIEDAWVKLLQRITDETNNTLREMGRLGMTSYEAALDSIREQAGAKSLELIDAGMTSGFGGDLAALINQRNALQREIAMQPTHIAWNEANGNHWQAEKSRQALIAQTEALGVVNLQIRELVENVSNMTPEIQAWVSAQTSLLDAQNAARATEMLSGLDRELERLGMSDAERALAEISDRAQEYIDTLTDLGQATAANIASVEAWAEAMRNSQAWRDGQTNISRAESDLNRAYADRRTEIERSIATFERFGTSIRDFRDSLLLGNLSPLNPVDQYMEARAQFESTALAAQSGDEDAIDALQSTARAFLDASRGMYASGDAYGSDFAEVMEILGGTETIADRERQMAQESLDALQTQVGALIDINSSVLSVEDAIMALQEAISAAPLHQTTGVTPMQIESLYQSLLGRGADQAGLDYWKGAAADGASIDAISAAIGRSTEASLASLYRDVLGRAPDAGGMGYWMDQISIGTTLEQIEAAFRASEEFLRRMPGYASGGFHYGGVRLVGEQGPEIELTGPARYWSFDQTRSMMHGGSDNAALVAEVRALREEVRALRAQQSQEHREAVTANYDANDRAASHIVNTQEQSARRDRAAARYA